MDITAGGETFSYDGTVAPLGECLAIEEAYGATYGRWQADLAAGAAKAFALLAWLVWRRAGREVDFAAILSGEVGLDVNEMAASMVKALAAADGENSGG